MNQRAKIELLHCDCMDYMAKCKDKEFDLAIVDPPYGFMKSNALNFRYDKIYENKAPEKKYFIELFRISKNQVIWGANYFTPHLEPRKSWLCWAKGQPVKNFSDCELAWTSFDILTTMIKLDSYGFNHADKRRTGQSTIHPTQKPILLYLYILKNYAKEGDRILDTHLGSGSIAIACWDMGFDLVGCEIDKDYYDAAVKRFETHKAQLQLF